MSRMDYLSWRWQLAHQHDRLIEWRSFAFLLSAEAKMAEIDGLGELRDDLLTLFDVAIQRMYWLQPLREAA